MYKLEYLPQARSDMVEIVRYISCDLCNPKAASHLATELIETGERMALFPYANPVYMPIKPLRYEYRRVAVGNYLMFYYVDEAKNTVTIARVLYAKRDYGKVVERG